MEIEIRNRGNGSVERSFGVYVWWLEGNAKNYDR